MKLIIAISALTFFGSNLMAQEKNDKINKVMDIYRTDAVPYLQKLVDAETGTDPSAARLNNARFNLLKTTTETKVKSQVTKACQENNAITIDQITTVTESIYRNNFTGLSKEFYDKARADVQKMPL